MRRSPAASLARAAVPDVVVRATRSSVRVYGSLSSARRPVPDFLVIGAKKGGTTSIANWLGMHRQVLPMIPRWQSAKSPHYFDTNYWRGEEWYRSHFPTQGARERRSRDTGARTVAGETSPYYLFHPAAAQRVAAVLPEARLIAVLREPVDRAYSHYWDRRATGHETLSTFEEACEAEDDRLSGLDDARLADPRFYDADHDHHSYLARGEYAAQLHRYLHHVGEDRMLVLSFDELRADPVSTFGQVQDFLGLDRRGAGTVLRAHNVRAARYPPIDPATRHRLERHFAPHNAALEKLLGRRLGWPTS